MDGWSLLCIPTFLVCGEAQWNALAHECFPFTESVAFPFAYDNRAEGGGTELVNGGGCDDDDYDTEVVNHNDGF